jgi:hypothetical protein
MISLRKLLTERSNVRRGSLMYSLRPVFQGRRFGTIREGEKVLSDAPRLAALAAALFSMYFASPAYAGDDASGKSDPSLSASSERCLPLAQVRGSIERHGGKLIDMTPEQFQFARGMFVVTALASTKLPPGDHAMLGEMPNGDIGVIFLDGDSACDVAVFGGSAKQMLIAVGVGSVTHVGGGV